MKLTLIRALTIVGLLSMSAPAHAFPIFAWMWM